MSARRCKCGRPIEERGPDTDMERRFHSVVDANERLGLEVVQLRAWARVLDGLIRPGGCEVELPTDDPQDSIPLDELDKLARAEVARVEELLERVQTYSARIATRRRDEAARAKPVTYTAEEVCSRVLEDLDGPGGCEVELPPDDPLRATGIDGYTAKVVYPGHCAHPGCTREALILCDEHRAGGPESPWFGLYEALRETLERCPVSYSGQREREIVEMLAHSALRELERERARRNSCSLADCWETRTADSDLCIAHAHSEHWREVQAASRAARRRPLRCRLGLHLWDFETWERRTYPWTEPLRCSLCGRTKR